METFIVVMRELRRVLDENQLRVDRREITWVQQEAKDDIAKSIAMNDLFDLFDAINAEETSGKAN